MSTQFLKTSKGKLSIGRSLDNDHVIDHPMVSKHHAMLSLTKDGWLLEDLDSANGTFFNGNQIKEPVTIGDKDTFQIGTGDHR
jgi:pSer/pThr/pTyr-binding forkhead associated (FHA) protein